MLPASNLIAWPTVPSMFCGGDRNFKRGDGSEETAVAVLVLCRCDSPIFIEGKIEAKHNRGKVSLRIGLRPCPHHGPVRLRLSTRQSAGASPQSPAPELPGT